MAMRKVIWVMKKPRTEAAKIFGRSLFSTFSAGMNRDRSQKSAPAPSDLRQKIVSGEIRWLPVKSLQIIMWNQRMA